MNTQNKIFYTKCRLCKRNIKQNKSHIILIHRRCWLNNRSFDDRRFDYMFCNEKKRGNNFFVIRPISPLLPSS